MGSLPSGWKGPTKLVERNGQIEEVRDVDKAPLTEAEKAQAYAKAPAFDPHQGKHAIPADKRGHVPVPASGFHRKMALTDEVLAQLLDRPDLRKSYIGQLDGPKSGYAAMAGYKAAGVPLLNASPRDSVAGMMRKGTTLDKHAKERMVRRVIVKAGSTKAAQYNGDWATHQWGIFSLKYSRGVVIVDHKGRESAKVFTSIGAALSAIKQIEMEIVK